MTTAENRPITRAMAALRPAGGMAAAQKGKH
jgi:hypothetical protein